MYLVKKKRKAGKDYFSNRDILAEKLNNDLNMIINCEKKEKSYGF